MVRTLLFKVLLVYKSSCLILIRPELVMSVENFADNFPFAVNFEQVEIIGKTITAQLIGIHTGGRCRACDVNIGNRHLGIVRRLKMLINGWEQGFANQTARQALFAHAVLVSQNMLNGFVICGVSGF